MIPGALIALYGYRVAISMMYHSNTGSRDQLPTPYQLSLLLGTYNGGILTIWNWISYLFWKRRRKMIPVFTFAFVIFVTSSCLAYMIWAADTWFHVATSTILLSITRNEKQAIWSDFGFGIAPLCGNFFNDNVTAQWWDCHTAFLNGARVNSGYAIMADVDPDRVLMNIPSNGSSHAVSFVSGAKGFFDLDYVTTTFGFGASCKLTTKECNMRGFDNGEGGVWIYNCTSAFSGVLAADAKYNEAAGNCRSYGHGCYGLYGNNSFLGGLSQSSHSINPFAVGVAAQVVGLAVDLTFSPEIVSSADFSNFIMACEVEVSDIKYSVVNGTTTILSSTPSNDTVAYFSTGWDSLDVGVPAMQNAIVMAATTGVTTTDDLVANFATSLGKIFAAFSVDSFVERPNLLEQYRETMLVARVPKAPFWTLVVLCFLMSLLGLLLGIVTIKSSPSATRDLHSRLSVGGIIATHFEDEDQLTVKVISVENLFAEKAGRRDIRVGVSQSEHGGWTLRSYDN